MGEHIKTSTGRKIFNIFNICLMLILVAVTLYPLLNQLALSFSSTGAILNREVGIIPKGFTLVTYRDIMKGQIFWRNYRNTILYTLVGTSVSLSLTTMCAYALSKRDLVGGKTILGLLVFTMFFGGGLIPTFMLIRNLKMLDTIWAIVLPGAIVPYHVLIMKTFFQGLPQDLEDAGKIDGLGQYGYFMRIVLPLSKPIIATMTLFISVIYWNDWFSALMYLNDGAKHPVTLYLRNIMMGATMAAQSGQSIDATVKSIPQSMQAASMILVIFPVLCIYPFVQKYFVQGVMIGSIKG